MKNKDFDYYRSIDTILKNRTETTPMPDEKVISRYRTKAYDDDFMKLMEDSEKWLNNDKAAAKEKVSENSLFVNGNCSAVITHPINTLIVVGDISEKASVKSERTLHIPPEKTEDVLVNILERESQKSWTTKTEARTGRAKDNSGFFVKRAAMLVDVFSALLKNLDGTDDITFVSYCRKIIEWSEKIKKENHK